MDGTIHFSSGVASPESTLTSSISLEFIDGIIAITMTDLVDEELRELAEMDIEDAVAGTP